MARDGDRISRRRVLGKAAATGLSLGVVRSSNRLSPVQTAEASSNPLEYISSFSDDDNVYEYTDNWGWDASVATNFGIVQDNIAAGTNECGGYYYDHHIAVWATGIFTRTNGDELKSGGNFVDQSTHISTTANFCSDEEGPLLYEGAYGGNRFFDLTGVNTDQCPHNDVTQASQWFATDHYDDENYEDYDDVEYWADRWESETNSDKDHFNAWQAGVGVLGGITGALTAGTGPLGLAALGVSAVSFLDGLSELGHGNRASISNDNKEIQFWHNTSEAGVIGHVVEFTARVPAGRKYYISVDMGVDVAHTSKCFDHPLSENVEENACFQIVVPSNPEGGSPADADPVYAYSSSC